ncbi:MAG: hypothetical protein EXR68_06650 [Dehalococcoidia bacterium]|nr:hypothetical protein [Dehalococcoidia bacterium]
MGIFSGRLIFVFQHPLRTNGRTLGVVSGTLDATDIAQLARSDTYSKRMVIVGHDGVTFELGAEGVASLPESVSSAVARLQTTGEPCPVVSVEEIAWTCSPVGSSVLATLLGTRLLPSFRLRSIQRRDGGIGPSESSSFRSWRPWLSISCLSSEFGGCT